MWPRWQSLIDKRYGSKIDAYIERAAINAPPGRVTLTYQRPELTQLNLLRLEPSHEGLSCS